MHKEKQGSDDATDLFELVKEMEGETCVCMQRLLSLSSAGLSADCRTLRSRTLQSIIAPLTACTCSPNKNKSLCRSAHTVYVCDVPREQRFSTALHVKYPSVGQTRFQEKKK